MNENAAPGRINRAVIYPSPIHHIPSKKSHVNKQQTILFSLICLFLANDDNDTERKKLLYESFGQSRDPHSLAREETFREKKRDGKANYVNRDNPQQGNTIYVHGDNINEDILRLGFSSFGIILNITTEPSKKYGISKLTLLIDCL